MRVAHIVRQFHPAAGDEERFVYNLVRHQRLLGISAEVVTLDRLGAKRSSRLPHFDSVGGIPVRRVAGWGWGRYQFAPGVVACVEPFDAVHVHGTGAFADCLALTQVFHRKPMTLTIAGEHSRMLACTVVGPAFHRVLTRLSLLPFKRIFVRLTGPEILHVRNLPERKLRYIEDAAGVTTGSGSAETDARPGHFGRALSRLSGAAARLTRALADLTARPLGKQSRAGETEPFEEAPALAMHSAGPVVLKPMDESSQEAGPSWADVARSYIAEYEGLLGWRERKILGVSIRPLGQRQSVARIDQALAAGQRLNVCFANAHFLNLARENERFRGVLENFLVLNDGIGTDIASRLKFGRPFAANLNGTDFVPYLLARTRHRLRIFLVGTSDAAVATAAQRLSVCYPRHRIVGYRNGFFNDEGDIEQTCREIRAARADCVLVGMGNPLQEMWIDEHGGKTGAKLLLGVGALLDFQAGTVRRAPAWVRKVHCEWVYRLLQEPRRLFRRYVIGNVVFLGRALADARS